MAQLFLWKVDVLHGNGKGSIDESLKEVIDIIDGNHEIKKKNSQYFFGQGWEK